MKTKAILASIASAALLLATTTFIAGCAQDTAEDTNTGSQEVRQQLADQAIQGKLRGILTGITFTSEGDYGYTVIEGDTVTPQTRLSTKVLREKLAAAVLANTDDRRDIKPAACRSRRLSVSSAIADGEAAEVGDPDSDDYTYAHHDKQVMIALKTMRSQLRNVVGYTFGTNESGDQDELGTVVYVYAGISKTTGKIIAIITQAVYT